VNLPADAPGLQAWRAFLEQFPGTSSVDLILPDLTGVPRGKRFTADAFAAVAEGGLAFATSLYGMDTTGTNVAASGLIWEEGDADRPCVLDWATLAPAPWRDGGAQILGGLADHDGTPFFADPRAVLRRVAARFEPQGLRPVAALELEFYLLDPASLKHGPLRPPRAPGGARPSETQVYSLDDLDDQAPFLERLACYCAAQGVPAKSAVAEYAPGQYEVNLGHVGDPVLAADHAFLLKRAVKAAARAVGLEATFMAKPFAGLAACGMHVHLSLVDGAGANRFAADEQALRHAIGGLRASMAEAMLIFAPNANSFRRLRPGSYAPLAPTWGHNNRTVALRIPAGGAAARRIEHRAPGSDANPYLALAAVLAGVHHGLEQELDPGPPTLGNAYAQAAPALPRTWIDAIETFGCGAILPGYLGPRLCAVYQACRIAERDRFSDIITPTEYSWYLRTV
jgi:glutamine synthetase